MNYSSPRAQLESTEWIEYQADPANCYHKINAQQLAKTPVFLDCLEAPKGFSFVQLDYTSLEDYVMAELSQDPLYLEMYASGKPHDGYLFNSIHLLDDDGKINAVYNIDNPTKESVGAAKKQFKSERTIGKLFKLMSIYKASWRTIHRALTLAEVDITHKQAQDLHDKFWNEMYSTIVDYEENLLAEVDQRDGWFFNAMGRPFVVTDRKRKDILNTQCQSTGHDATDMLILTVEKLAKERNIPAIPIIPDYHDETIWLCQDSRKTELAEVMSDAVEIVNDLIKFSIRLKGEPEITNNFTEFKGPDEVEWYADKCNA